MCSTLYTSLRMGALSTAERRKHVRTQMCRCTRLLRSPSRAQCQDDTGGLMEPAVMQPCVNIKPVVNTTANYLYSFQSLWFVWEHRWIVFSVLLTHFSEFLPDNSKWTISRRFLVREHEKAHMDESGCYSGPTLSAVLGHKFLYRKCFDGKARCH
jgi:hypothetical protein